MGISTDGKALVLERLFGIGSEGPLTHMGVGTDSTAYAVGQTQLNPSVSGSVFLKAYDALPIRTSLTVAAITTFATGEANFNWQEIALFNGGTNGTDEMFNRIAPIGPFNKTSAVSIVATVEITQA